MKNYKCNFIKVEKEVDEKGNVLSKTYQHLGSVVIDDNNISNEFTLASKAYRQAPQFIHADRIELQEVKL